MTNINPMKCNRDKATYIPLNTYDGIKETIYYFKLDNLKGIENTKQKYSI